MRIGDIALCMPRMLFTATFAKMPRFELGEKAKDNAVNEGFYHFVRDEATADTIIKSEYLRPSDAVTSYGKPCAFMFCGNTDIENYTKNLSTNKQILNPYLTPNMVVDAIVFKPKNREDLNNYRYRGLTDNVFMYEGYCVLPHDAVKKVKMVPDLVRDENGKPIKNKKGEYSAEFREAREDELLPGKKYYMPREDYLQFMEEKAIQYGYMKKGERVQKQGVVELTRMEGHLMRKSIKNNLKDMLSSFWNRVKSTKLEKSAEDVLKDFSFANKNPYRNKKFAEQVIELQTKEDLEQYNLNEVLTEFNNSKTGQFFSEKYNQIEGNIKRKGIHGKDHSNRVSMMAMMIAEKEGLFEGDNRNHLRDVLLTASMYHDIGRITDKGPHAKRGAKKIEKMDLRYLDSLGYNQMDRKLVMALVESHEGSPDKINKVMLKYGIHDPEYVHLGQKMNSVLRDADALDRVRLDSNRLLYYNTNLKPQFLVNKTSKQFLKAAYQLEYLTKKVPNIQNIMGIGVDPTKVKHYKENEFDERIKFDGEIVIPSKEDLQKDSQIQQRGKDDTERTM